MNAHEKCFEWTLNHYQNELRKREKDFYWYRPSDMRRFDRSKKPCDFWFFDESFVALEMKYRNGNKIQRSQIKQHQFKSLSYFAENKCRSYLVVSFNFNPKITPMKAKTFAINIIDVLSYFENFNKTLNVDNSKQWNGIELFWKPKIKSFNLDPIIAPKHRIFNGWK